MKALATIHMSKKAHLNHLQEALPFAGVLFAGTLIFLVDYYELSKPFVREIILTLISMTKSVWFVRFWCAASASVPSGNFISTSS